MSENENDLTPESEADVLPGETPSEPPVNEAELSADDDTLILAMEADAAAVEDAAEPEYDYALVIPAAAPPADDWMLGDIDVALAAVASLSEIMPERQAEAEIRADAKRSAPSFVPEMAMPPLATLKRGQFGSLVPALLLIAFGAWLTLTTTTGTPPDPLLTAAIAAGGIVVALLAQWLGTGRWSRGLLFFALLALLVVGVAAFALQPTGIAPLRAYPLLFAALGLAMGLAGLLARPFNARLAIPGGLLVLAAIVGMAATLDYVPGNILSVAGLLAPVVLGVVVLLWLLPLIFRRSK